MSLPNRQAWVLHSDTSTDCPVFVQVPCMHTLVLVLLGTRPPATLHVAEHALHCPHWPHTLTTAIKK